MSLAQFSGLSALLCTPDGLDIPIEVIVRKLNEQRQSALSNTSARTPAYLLEKEQDVVVHRLVQQSTYTKKRAPDNVYGSGTDGFGGFVEAGQMGWDLGVFQESLKRGVEQIVRSIRVDDTQQGAESSSQRYDGGRQNTSRRPSLYAKQNESIYRMVSALQDIYVEISNSSMDYVTKYGSPQRSPMLASSQGFGATPKVHSEERSTTFDTHQPQFTAPLAPVASFDGNSTSDASQVPVPHSAPVYPSQHSGGYSQSGSNTPAYPTTPNMPQGFDAAHDTSTGNDLTQSGSFLDTSDNAEGAEDERGSRDQPSTDSPRSKSAFRSNSISGPKWPKALTRKKSKKVLTRTISNPHLISTTQRLDNAVDISKLRSSRNSQTSQKASQSMDQSHQYVGSASSVLAAASPSVMSEKDQISANHQPLMPVTQYNSTSDAGAHRSPQVQSSPRSSGGAGRSWFHRRSGSSGTSRAHARNGSQKLSPMPAGMDGFSQKQEAAPISPPIGVPSPHNASRSASESMGTPQAIPSADSQQALASLGLSPKGARPGQDARRLNADFVPEPLTYVSAQSDTMQTVLPGMQDMQPPQSYRHPQTAMMGPPQPAQPQQLPTAYHYNHSQPSAAEGDVTTIDFDQMGESQAPAAQPTQKNTYEQLDVLLSDINQLQKAPSITKQQESRATVRLSDLHDDIITFPSNDIELVDDRAGNLRLGGDARSSTGASNAIQGKTEYPRQSMSQYDHQNVSTRKSNASLYDMYIRNGYEDNPSPVKGRLKSPYKSDLPPPSFSVPGRSTPIPAPHSAGRHPLASDAAQRGGNNAIWQVVAGLSDRSSMYSVGGQDQQRLSDMSLLMRSGPNQQGDAGTEARPESRIYSDEQRDFFKGAKSAPLERPLEPPPGQSAWPGYDNISAPVVPGSSRSKDNDIERTTPTRIVYYDDDDLGTIMEQIAQGNNSARIELRRRSAYHVDANAGSSVQQEELAKADESKDAEDEHLSSVEERIYSLLRPTFSHMRTS